MSDADLDYRERAELHRPGKSWFVGAAVRRMAQQGLTEGDIGVALGLDRTAVRSALTHALDASDTCESGEPGAGE